MAERIVYVVATPSPNRNTEMDRVATALGPDRVHLIFIASEWQSASWRPSFPDVCPFHCLDAPADLNGIAADEIVDLLGSLDPSVVVVGGYAQKAARDVMAWSRQRRVPYCLRSDSSIWTDRHKGWAKYTVRRIRLPRHVKAAHRCLISGRFNREFWQRYGMRPAQEGWWPQWIDYDRFAAARTIGVDERHSLLAAHGIETTLNFLYVGRLIGLKHLDRLCEGLTDCPPHAGLIVVGSGPEEANLRRATATALRGVCTSLVASNRAICPNGTPRPTPWCSPAVPGKTGAWSSMKRPQPVCRSSVTGTWAPPATWSSTVAVAWRWPRTTRRPGARPCTPPRLSPSDSRRWATNQRSLPTPGAQRTGSLHRTTVRLTRINRAPLGLNASRATKLFPPDRSNSMKLLINAIPTKPGGGLTVLVGLLKGWTPDQL
ncbi:MAG: hypothetical protein R3C10_08360 [Pirellulales bacterium]